MGVVRLFESLRPTPRGFLPTRSASRKLARQAIHLIQQPYVTSALDRLLPIHIIPIVLVGINSSAYQKREGKPMTYTRRPLLTGRICPMHALEPPFTGSSVLRLGWCALTLTSAIAASAPAQAQQRNGSGGTGDDSLTWHGITLYGTVD